MARWIERALWLGIGLAMALLVGVIWMTFTYAPVEREMGIVQKIFFFHMPIAVNSFHAFFVNFLASALYLWRRKPVWDHVAVAGAEVGLLMATLTLVTGSLWARPIWNTWWNWEPRLTTMLILWLLYIGYLVLRGSVEEPGRRARYSAVWGLLAFVDVPLVYFSVHWFERELHPVVIEPGEGVALHPHMAQTLWISLTAFTLLSLCLIAVRARYAWMEERITHSG